MSDKNNQSAERRYTWAEVERHRAEAVADYKSATAHVFVDIGVSGHPHPTTKAVITMAEIVTPVRPLDRVWDGQTITEPGVYSGVSNAAYHRRADICAGPSISSGGLRRIETTSLAHYYATCPYNPGRVDEDDDSEALIFGRAAHTLLLGEEGFKTEYLIRPDAYPDAKGDEKAWNGNATWCRKWLADAARAGKTVLTKAQLDRIVGMAEAMARHPTIRGGILNGQIERSVFWRDPLTGVWLKSRPDALPEDDLTLVDLKSCASAHPLAVRKAISDHGYEQQLALAEDGLRETRGQIIRERVLVFVESKRPHAINIKPVVEDAINWGRRQNRRAIDRFAGLRR